MRFEVRWNNGYYKVFDTVEYADVGLNFTLKEAEKACATANSGRKVR